MMCLTICVNTYYKMVCMYIHCGEVLFRNVHLHDTSVYVHMYNANWINLLIQVPPITVQWGLLMEDL